MGRVRPFGMSALCALACLVAVALLPGRAESRRELPVVGVTAQTPVCSPTVTGSTGATLRLCITAYPTSLDNRSGLASTPGAYAATVTTGKVTANTVLGCPGERLKPTLCVTWTVNGAYALTDLFPPFQWQLHPMFYAAGTKTVKAVAKIDGMAVSATVPLTISGAASPSKASPNPGTLPGVTTALPVATIATVGDAPASQQSALHVADLIASWGPDMLFYLGDVYQRGSYEEFINHWHPASAFGRFNAITAPVVGNHEYKQWGAADPYFWYWNHGKAGPTATRAGAWYSFNLAGWHVIALNSDAPADPSSAQIAWLKQDLAAHPNSRYPCTIALFHRPRFSTSDISGNAAMTTLWEVMVNAGVDIFLNAHAHQYERSVPLRADGTLAPFGSGVTQFVVGTGGNGLGAWRPGASMDRFAFRTNTVVGAMRMVLRPGAADFEFVGTSGATVDAGTTLCDLAPPDPPPPPILGLRFADDFESGNLSKWTSSRGLVVQSSHVHAGSYAARATSTGSQAYALARLGTVTSQIAYRTRFKLIGRGANTVTLLRLRDAASGRIVSVNITSDGFLSYFNHIAAVERRSVTSVVAGAWHELEVRVRVNGADSAVEIWYDGLKVTALARTESLGTNAPAIVQLGDDSVSRTFDLAFDGVAVD